MPNFQFDRINFRVMCVLMLFIFLLTGCVARKTEKSEPVETTQELSAQEPAQASSAAAVEKATAENFIRSVDVNATGPNLEIGIRSSAKLTYTSIKQSFPFGIAVYLPGTGIDPNLMVAAMDDDRVSNIKVSYADESKTTAKVEILLNRDLPYEVREEGNSLAVVLLASAEAPGQENDNEQPAQTGMSLDTAAVSGAIQAPSTQPAIVTGIQFETVETGRSDILIETDHPIRYDVGWQSDSQLAITLFNTRIPIHQQRPLASTALNSAVVQVLPKSLSGSSGDSTLDIRIREKVPYRVVQDRNRLSLFFEPAAVRAPVVATAGNQGGGQPAGTAGSRPAALSPGAGAGVQGGTVSTEPESSAAEPESATMPALAAPRYSGEKIKLDFFDTDIKNVFRILRSVSGLNFAVDADVQGKVTLTLEEPVPWDQVLDLVLKMNGLGKKQEGNVVRIATMATLKKEDQDLQDVIAAQKKAEEQKKSLEPLVTEYIPINYSDASTDVQPHLAPLLTPDRGSISVDARTNMIIVTDTRDVIDKIQDMVFRLDTVTPQIMIEAKVVEVTKDFSRSIGIGWTLSNASDTISGFTDDFSLSLNEPSGEPSAGDFNFFRLFGSSATALNAKLSASEESGDVRIVSSPRILTLDNKAASIKQGLEYAYLERDDSGGSSVSFKQIDLLLEVTPHVTPDKRISMTVHLTKNDIAGVTTTGAPTLSTNEAQTELLVENNDTVVIGGIVKTSKTDDIKGLPFLTGIPILGQLFGTTTKVDDRNELLIFLTPSIVQLQQKRNVSRTVN